MTFHAKASGYADPALHAQGLYIGGNWTKGHGLPVLDPSTGTLLAEVADASPGAAHCLRRTLGKS